MAITVLEDFLVRLGASTDETSFNKFKSVLDTSSSYVDKYAGGVAKAFLKAQVEIVGAFGAISGAILTLVDKTINANISNRIYGESMLMNVGAARQMKMATDALGLSLDQIYWDKLSYEKFRDLTKIIDAFDRSNPDFQKKMEGLEMLQFQVTKLSLGFKLLAQSFTVSLFDKLLGGTGAGNKLTAWVDELLKPEKINALGDKLATFLGPILTETWKMFLDIGEAVKTFSDDFSELIGLISGDDSIEQSTDSFEKLSKALTHVIHGASTFVQWMSSAESVALHLAGALIHLAKALKDVFTLDFSGATDELSRIGDSVSAAQKRLSPGGGAILGGITGSGVGSVVGGVLGGPVGVPIGAGIGGGLSALGGYIWGKLSGGNQRPADEINKYLSAGPSSIDILAAAIQKQEGYYPGSLAYKNNNPGNLEFHNQAGAVLGVGGRFAKFPTYEAGLEAEKDNIGWYARHGYTLEGMIKKWAPFNENNTAAYIRNVSAATGIDPNQKLSSVTTISGGIHVTVTNSNANPQEIADAVKSKLDSQILYDQMQIAPAF